MTHGPAYLPTEIQYISDHENSRYPRNSLKSKWVLWLCTAFSKIIGIWVRLSLALIQWKKKKTLSAVVWTYTNPSQFLWFENSDHPPPSSGRWTAEDPAHGGPCKRDEAGYFPQGPSPVTGLQICWMEVFAASESNTPCLIILHLPRSLFSYKDVGGEWWLDKVCQQYGTRQWGLLTIAGWRGN